MSILRRYRFVLALLIAMALIQLHIIQVQAEETTSTIDEMVISESGCTKALDMNNLGNNQTPVIYMNQIFEYREEYKNHNPEDPQILYLPQSGRGWSFSVATNTLVLNGFSGSRIYVKSKTFETLNVVLKGKNVIESSSENVFPIDSDRVSIVFSGTGSLKVQRKVVHGAAIKIYDSNLSLEGSCKVEAYGKDNAVKVGVQKLGQGVSDSDNRGIVSVGEGCTLYAKTTYATEQKFLCTAIDCTSVTVRCGGKLIGETATGKNGYNSGINAPWIWTLDKGVYMRRGASSKDAKTFTFVPEKGICYASYNMYAPYMEVVTMDEQGAKVHNITYKLNGGTNHPDNPLSYTGVADIKLQNPTRAGYQFAGWYTNRKLTKKITRIYEGSKKNYTLYAKWTKIK